MTNLYDNLIKLNVSGRGLSSFLCIGKYDAKELIEAWSHIERLKTIQLNDHNRMILYHLTRDIEDDITLKRKRANFIKKVSYKFSKEEIQFFIDLERILYNHVMFVDFGSTLGDEAIFSDLSIILAKECLERGKVIVSTHPQLGEEMYYKRGNSVYNTQLNTVNFLMNVNDCKLSLTNNTNTHSSKEFIEKIINHEHTVVNSKFNEKPKKI